MEPPQPSIPMPLSHTDKCAVCEEQVGKWICPQCNGTPFCDKCWGTQQAHKARRVVVFSHEKLEAEVYHRLQGVFRQDRTELEQHNLHVSDTDTTWFGVVKPETSGPSSKPELGHSNRLIEIMLESQTGKYTERYPHLVSFVGHTGAGKSTVIKLLISQAEADIRSEGQEMFPAPVTGLSNDNVATTGYVHLYSDPATYTNQTPLLYADCEGLSGGENVPLGAIAKEKVENIKASSSSKHTTSGVSRVFGKGKKVLAWADNAKTQSRQHSVRELYPRILYTFSDVIIFVLREVKMFQSEVLPHLVQWARSSIDKSVNQPALPHIIIVLNATDNMVDSNYWNPSFATKKLLKDYRDSVHQVGELQRIVADISQTGHQIQTTEQLLMFYYASISVVRIPVKGSYLQIEEQIKKLYNTIRLNCNLSYYRKRSARMLLTAERMQQYVTSAFDHFACRLDQPFDFVKEALRYTRIPKTFGGHILNLMLSLYHTSDVRDERHIPNPCDLLTWLSRPIACCLMLAAVREDMQLQYETLLERVFSKPISWAFESFRNMWVRCAFENDGVACCNVQHSHDKGHQAPSGKIIGKGPYISPDSLQNFTRAHWMAQIGKSLQELNSRASRIAAADELGGDMTEMRRVSNLHQQECSRFYSRFTNYACHFVPKLTSTATCFTCIKNIPEHVLPCGHALCRPCIQLFGESVHNSEQGGGGTFILRRCPLPHESSQPQEGREVRVRFKPRDAGVRVLCLDGGGVRGIIELAILEAIEGELGRFVKVQDFFDLIVGTSTGGIIALGLGVKNWSVPDCIDKFKQLSTQAFTKRPTPMLISIARHKSIYKTKPLEEALKQEFGKDLVLFGAQSQLNGERSDIKVAVTSTSAVENDAVIMTNYNIATVEKENPFYQRLRSKDASAEPKVWEAARATSAAPLYFKSYLKPETGIAYTDGAIHHNCPARIADHEWRLIWNDVGNWSPDILLSLGTGLGVVPDDVKRKEVEAAAKTHEKAKTSGIRYMLRTAYGIIDSQLSCERQWRDYYDKIHRHGPEHREILELEAKRRHLRVNVVLQGQRAALDDVKKLSDIEEQAARSISNDPDIREVAHRLVASCFYFEQKRGGPFSQKSAGYTIEGSIRCRFEEASSKLKDFGGTLKRFLSGSFRPHFIVEENYGTADQSRHSSEYFIETATMQNMCDTGVFDFKQTIEIHTTKSNLTRISLCLQDKAHYKNFPRNSSLSISGFPRVLSDDGLMNPLPPVPAEEEEEDDMPPEFPSESPPSRDSIQSWNSGTSVENSTANKGLSLFGDLFVRRSQSASNIREWKGL